MSEENKDLNNSNNKENIVEKKLLETRSIFIYGEINQELAQKVSSQLIILSSISDEPIKIYLNSQGGHVEAGDTIHDMIKFVKPEIKMIGTGWVASAGVTIYLAAEKENRFMLPNTRFMIHQPMGGTQGQITDMEIEVEEVKRMRKRLNNLIANATGQNFEKVEKDTERNYWMSPEETIDYGIASKVISSFSEIE